MILRENQQFTMGRGFPVIRRTLLRIGELLSEKGLLDSPFEAFFLKHSEIKEIINDPTKVEQIRNEVFERMKSFYIFTKLEPPDIIEPSNIEELKQNILRGKEESATESKKIVGIGVSPGIYKGRVRIMLEPSKLHEFEPGEILVCPTTNPAWTPVFPLAGAVVTDIGGMLSHGAVVAREYRIPAVLGTDNATERLKTGDKIEVDGDSGMITIIE
jgi:pyruvate,water dikinase